MFKNGQNIFFRLNFLTLEIHPYGYNYLLNLITKKIHFRSNKLFLSLKNHICFKEYMTAKCEEKKFNECI